MHSAINNFKGFHQLEKFLIPDIIFFYSKYLLFFWVLKNKQDATLPSHRQSEIETETILIGRYKSTGLIPWSCFRLWLPIWQRRIIAPWFWNLIMSPNILMKSNVVRSGVECILPPKKWNDNRLKPDLMCHYKIHFFLMHFNFLKKLIVTKKINVSCFLRHPVEDILCSGQ